MIDFGFAEAIYRIYQAKKQKKREKQQKNINIHIKYIHEYMSKNTNDKLNKKKHTYIHTRLPHWRLAFTQSISTVCINHNLYIGQNILTPITEKEQLLLNYVN
jgi:hypothetical protein